MTKYEELGKIVSKIYEITDLAPIEIGLLNHILSDIEHDFDTEITDEMYDLAYKELKYSFLLDYESTFHDIYNLIIQEFNLEDI